MRASVNIKPIVSKKKLLKGKSISKVKVSATEWVALRLHTLFNVFKIHGLDND